MATVIWLVWPTLLILYLVIDVTRTSKQGSVGEGKEEGRQGAQSLPPPCSLLESVFKTDFVSCLVFPRNVIDYVIAAS